MGQLVRVAQGAEGSQPGRLRLTVNELGGQNQLGLIAAIRCRHYSSAPTARSTYGAEELRPLDAAALATRSGAIGPTVDNVVRHTNLASSWTSVLELRLAAGAYLTHTGTYRLIVRVYSPDGSAVKLRSIYDVGDLQGPRVENAADVKQIPGANNFYRLDLGELRLDEVPVGPHRWSGEIQAKGAAGGEDIDIDAVGLYNTDEGFVKLRAPQLTATASQAAYGPRSGGTFADAGGGVNAWTAVSNVAASDDTYATTPNPGVNGIGNTLKVTNFGFAVPAGAAIQGIKVEVEQRYYGSIVGVENAVQIIKGGAVQTTNRASAGIALSRTDAYRSFGNEADLWGTTWAHTDINASNFGVALSYQTFGGGIAIDHVRITVYYTPSITLPQDAVLFASQSAELSWRGHFREDSTGTAYGPVSEQVGDLLRMPIAGSENRPVEFTVLSSRGDFDQLPDGGPDQISVDGTVRPCYLFPPGS